MFTKYFEGVSMKFQVNFQGVSKKFYVAWPSSQLPEQKEGLLMTDNNCDAPFISQRGIGLPVCESRYVE